MSLPDFASVFTVEAGRIYWKLPPKNHAQRKGDEAGFITYGKGKNKSYWYVRAFGRTFKRGRVIFAMTHGRWPTPCLDHIDGNSLDDRIENLRECTYSQNNISARDKPSLYGRGVVRTKQGRFMARLGKSLGTFDTPEEARAVYSKKRREIYGDFA